MQLSVIGIRETSPAVIHDHDRYWRKIPEVELERSIKRILLINCTKIFFPKIKQEVNKMHMNTIELTHHLFEMACNQTKYAMNWCTGVINAIIVQYLTKPHYYEEQAIATFQGFLDNGVLVW